MWAKEDAVASEKLAGLKQKQVRIYDYLRLWYNVLLLLGQSKIDGRSRRDL
jgi:hypothetical protein